MVKSTKEYDSADHFNTHKTFKSSGVCSVCLLVTGVGGVVGSLSRKKLKGRKAYPNPTHFRSMYTYVMAW